MNPFTTAFVKAPKRASFDFSHSNTVGLRIGALTPTLCHQIFPNDEVKMSLEQIARLAPMPVPTFVNLKVRHDFFFVPLRLLYGTEYLDKLFGSDTSLNRANALNLEYFYQIFTGITAFGSSTDGKVTASSVPFAGSLFDFLGYPVLTDRNGGLNSTTLQALADLADPSASGDWQDVIDSLPATVANSLSATPPINIERLFAYHFIWRDWYRFTGIESNIVAEPYLHNGILSVFDPGNITFEESHDNISDFYPNYVFDSSDASVVRKLTFADLGALKYAHLTKDMFTSARYGSKPTVLIPTGQNATIPALREASAIQRFIDLISITGQRYFDKVKGIFGVEPEGPKDDRVQFLARYQQFIKVGEVLTTATTEQGTTGDYAGRGILIDGKYLFKRRFTEHGYLFCITSIIPDVAYSGLSRELTDISVYDSPIPSLAEVGDQTIYNREVSFIAGNIPGVPLQYNQNNTSFGDQFRYYAYKSLNNEVHGFFLMSTARPWSPLLPNNYVIQNGETETPVLLNNPIDASRVYPAAWNYVFNDVDDEIIFGDRLFFNLDFYESVIRSLPKYINYHL